MMNPCRSSCCTLVEHILPVRKEIKQWKIYLPSRAWCRHFLFYLNVVESHRTLLKDALLLCSHPPPLLSTVHQFGHFLNTYFQVNFDVKQWNKTNFDESKMCSRQVKMAPKQKQSRVARAGVLTGFTVWNLLLVATMHQLCIISVS